MEQVLNRFKERNIEVDKYYKVLQLLDNEDTKLYRTSNNRKILVKLDQDALKIMKSTCFLLLYNLIESSIKDSFAYLYTKISSENGQIIEYKECFQKIWLDQQFISSDPISSNQKTYRDIAKSIVDKLLKNQDFTLDPSKIQISGNLDARKIREMFERHQISLTQSRSPISGAELVTVKDNRNGLAHGDISFSECGRQYTIEDLVNIKTQTVKYLKLSIANFKRYTDAKLYAI